MNSKSMPLRGGTYTHGVGKSRLTVVCEIVYSCFITYYCIICHTNNCKPTFAPPCL